MANSQSTLTLQNILDKVMPLGDVNPVLNGVSGYQLEPFLTICTDVMNEIYGLPFPHKWNEIKIPQFYTNSFQQDYALLNPGGTSFFDLEWIERGIAVQMTSNALPKPWSMVICGRQQTQAITNFSSLASFGWSWPKFGANYFPNFMLYYGTWGAGNTGNPTFGNNPGPGSVYTDPLTSNLQGQPSNPINQIIDPNGNIQVVTAYGTCGASAPAWPARDAAPGTQTQDGTTTWTVVDPNGIGIRILPVPNQAGVVFQFNLVGQRKAKRFKDLGETLDPFPDKYEPYFRAGVIAQCYRYSSIATVQAKFEKNHMLWMKSLLDLRVAQDRELEQNRFVPEQGIMSRGTSRTGYVGAAWPFNYPN